MSREIAPHPELTEVLVHTGQHFDQNMSSIFFEELDIAEPNINLGIMGTHGQNTGQMIQALEAAIMLNHQTSFWCMAIRTRLWLSNRGN